MPNVAKRCGGIKLGFLALGVFLLSGVTGVGQSRALADELGNSGTLTIAAENLFGFAFGEFEQDFHGRNHVERDYNIFGLGMSQDPTPLWTPRLALDGFVIDSLSVGGSLGIIFWDDDDDDDDDDGFAIFFSPRVGYLYMFADWVGIWGRGGFTYYSYDQDFHDRNLLALDLEGMFPFVVNENFGFLVGVVARFGLDGDYDHGDHEHDFNEWTIGISIGILGWIGL